MSNKSTQVQPKKKKLKIIPPSPPSEQIKPGWVRIDNFSATYVAIKGGGRYPTLESAMEAYEKTPEANVIVWCDGGYNRPREYILRTGEKSRKPYGTNITNWQIKPNVWIFNSSLTNQNISWIKL